MLWSAASWSGPFRMALGAVLPQLSDHGHSIFGPRFLQLKCDALLHIGCPGGYSVKRVLANSHSFFKKNVVTISYGQLYIAEMVPKVNSSSILQNISWVALAQKTSI